MFQLLRNSEARAYCPTFLSSQKKGNIFRPSCDNEEMEDLWFYFSRSDFKIFSVLFHLKIASRSLSLQMGSACGGRHRKVIFGKMWNLNTISDGKTMKKPFYRGLMRRKFCWYLLSWRHPSTFHTSHNSQLSRSKSSFSISAQIGCNIFIHKFTFIRILLLFIGGLGWHL